MRKVIAVRKDSYSVLIVDADCEFADTLGLRVIERNNLSLCGKVYSGDAVLPVVKEKMPDIIIMDLTLPALDGISVIRMLQKDLKYKPVIIITSAYSNDMQRYLINDIPTHISSGNQFLVSIFSTEPVIW
jgi:DNA-binding response OmpR family regulator